MAAASRVYKTRWSIAIEHLSVPPPNQSSDPVIVFLRNLIFTFGAGIMESVVLAFGLKLSSDV